MKNQLSKLLASTLALLLCATAAQADRTATYVDGATVNLKFSANRPVRCPLATVMR